MLILVIGAAGSGKSFFTEHKLFCYIGNQQFDVIREPTPAQLKTPEIAEKITNSVLVIEAGTDKDIPQELRPKADLYVFMTHLALGDFFNRQSNDVHEICNKRVYCAAKAVCGVDYTPVVFDPNGKRFIIHYD